MENEKGGIYDNPEVDFAFEEHQKNESKRNKKYDKDKKKIKDKIFSFGGPLDPHERCTLYSYAERMIEEKGMDEEEAWDIVNRKIEKIVERRT